MAVLAPTYTPFAVWDSGTSDYWDNVTMVTGTDAAALDPNVIGGSRVQVQFSRGEAAGVRENVALFDLNFSTNAGLGSAWSYLADSTLASVETALDALWTTLKVGHGSHWILSGYVWRHWKADYPLGKTGLSKPSPIYRVTTRSVAGTNAGAGGFLADQTAMSITFRTASRKHWGRCYLPAPAGDKLDTNSRFLSAWCDTVAGAFNTLFDTTTNLAAETHPVIWSTKHRGFLTVDTLAVDNVPDVVRRRRPYQRTYVKTYG